MTRTTDHYTLTTEDVGRKTIRAFGQSWPVSDFLGRVLPGDVGKRVYPVRDNADVRTFLQVENDAQRDARLGIYGPRRARDLVELAATMTVTLDGRPAKVTGARLPFARVSLIGSGLSAEWSWETVERILTTRNGAFKS